MDPKLLLLPPPPPEKGRFSPLPLSTFKATIFSFSHFSIFSLSILSVSLLHSAVTPRPSYLAGKEIYIGWSYNTGNLLLFKDSVKCLSKIKKYETEKDGERGAFIVMCPRWALDTVRSCFGSKKPRLLTAVKKIYSDEFTVVKKIYLDEFQCLYRLEKFGTVFGHLGLLENISALSF